MIFVKTFILVTSYCLN